MQLHELEGRRLAILGAGREGRATYTWLRSRLPTTVLAVIAESPADPGFAAALAEGDDLFIEPLCVNRLKSFEVLVRSPGISAYRSELRSTRALGVEVTTPSNLWFAAHPAARTICITGTKGKSTTAALVAHLLRTGGAEVRLAGNIGTPLLACDDRDVDWWVIELSSYQIADLEAAPGLALILNFSPEHLDWHRDVETYRRDKFRLADLAGAGKVILNAEDPALASHFKTRPGVTWFNSADDVHVKGGQLFFRDRALHVSIPPELPGRHNLTNVAAALSVVHAVGKDLQQAVKAVPSFRSLPHRLQLLGQMNGVSWIDDSISSTPVATAAALEALQDRNVILLVGGFDRGLDWGSYVPGFLDWPPKAVIGMPDNGAAIVEVLRGTGVDPERGLHCVSDLASAVDLALDLARPGDWIVLSPGAPSFPRFIDYRDRGRQFARLCGFDEGESR